MASGRVDVVDIGTLPPLGEVPRRMYAQVVRPERYGDPATAFQHEVIDTPELGRGEVLVAHLRGVEPARTWLRKARTEGPLAVSVVSIAELTGGMRSAERREVWSLLSALRAEAVTELIARRAGELMRRYRRSHAGIGIADYLIAATVQHRGAALATLNVRHFPMFPDIEPPFPLP